MHTFAYSLTISSFVKDIICGTVGESKTMTAKRYNKHSSIPAC
jgi:hypothetical protein